MSFVEGLARGLSGLPQALMYGQEKRRKDAYRKEISGLSSAEGSADSPFDNEAAARVAWKYGDHRSALGYRNAATDARARDAAGKRQQGLDKIAAEDRTRRMTREDYDMMEKRAKHIAPRFAAMVKAGDVAGADGMVSKNPGVFRHMRGLGPKRTPVGIDARTGEDGQPLWALRVQNADTETEGPETSPPDAAMTSKIQAATPDELLQFAQPYLDEEKVDKPQLFEGADGRKYWSTPGGEASLAIPGMEAPPKKSAKLLTLQKGEDRVTLREDDPRIDGMIKDGYNTGREPLVRVEGAKDKTVQLANKIRELRESDTPDDNAIADRLELKLTFGEKPPEAYAKAMSSVPSARAAISDAYTLIKQHGITGALKPTERAKLKQAWNALVGNMVTLEARGANLTGNEERIIEGILGGKPTDLFARGIRGDESFLQALQNGAKYVETRAASIVSAYTKPFSSKTNYPWEQDAQPAAQPGPPSAQPALPQAPEPAAQSPAAPAAPQPAQGPAPAPVAASGGAQAASLPLPEAAGPEAAPRRVASPGRFQRFNRPGC